MRPRLNKSYPQSEGSSVTSVARVDPRRNLLKAVIYIRVSTEEQARKGISLEGQELELRAYCKTAGLDVVEVIADPGVSGFRPLGDRPGGLRLLEALASGEAQAVVAWKLDRLFRNAANALSIVEGWEKKGVHLHLKDLGGTAVDTGSAIGKVFLAMMAAFAQLERDQTSERTRSAMDLKRARGEYTGGRVPYGFSLRANGKTLAIDEFEQEAIRVAKDLRAVEGLSLRKIGAELEQRGFLPRAATAWAPSSVRAILRLEVA